ncbi:MAG: indolepyruvate oxidoreductase subunit beta [Candidatus Methanomethylicaceae archaeon]
MRKCDILIVGVGGQGIILASDIIAEVGLAAGYDVKKSDVLGLAVRGGSVVSQVRWGEKVEAPVIIPGQVDFLLAFEPLEALRALSYASPSTTTALVNIHPIPPVSVSSGETLYPDLRGIRIQIQSYVKQSVFFNATELALKIGTVRVTNMIILGAFAFLLLDIVPLYLWEKAIYRYVPKNYKDINLEAFRKGQTLLRRG